MKFPNLALLIILIAFFGCSEKPEIQPDVHKFLAIHPNPAIYSSNINVMTDKPYTLRIFDLKGEVMVEEQGTGPEDYSIQLPSGEKGKYHIILQVESKTITTQLIQI